MREFNKLFVIALPRCATVSMGQALGVLGIPTAHLGKIYGESGSEHHHPLRLARMLQQIEAGQFQLDLLAHCRGLTDYPCCIFPVIRNLDRQYPGSLFINIQRQASLTHWLQSIEMQFVGTELLAQRADAPAWRSQYTQVMLRFRELTFGSQQFEAQAFAAAYHNFQQAVDSYFASRDDLLVFEDISQLASHGYEQLGQFLSIAKDSLPSDPFPQCNTHSQQPRTAFLEALQAGLISSQTGIQIGSSDNAPA
jgi:Sulfotransferase domain